MKKLLSIIVAIGMVFYTSYSFSGNIGGSIIGSQTSFVGTPEVGI
jgi:hypothetical protein